MFGEKIELIVLLLFFSVSCWGVGYLNQRLLNSPRRYGLQKTSQGSVDVLAWINAWNGPSWLACGRDANRRLDCICAFVGGNLAWRR